MTELLQWLNTAALVVFAALFIRGDILSRKTVDKILKEAENRTDKVVLGIKEGMEGAVRDGIVAASAEIQNGHGRKKKRKL